MESRSNRSPAEILEEKLGKKKRKKKREKKRTEQTPKQILDSRVKRFQRAKAWGTLAKKLTATVLVVYLFLGVVFGLAIVRGRSMYPNLKTGDIVFFIRVGRTYQPGNVVIIYMPDGEKLVKRIVATEGDTVDLDMKTGKLLVNGEVREEKYIFDPTYQVQGGTEFPITLPKGSVFVLGDNRTVSSDSREFGIISEEQIGGNVLLLFRIYEVEK